jgi:hypothetical protein
MVAGDDPGFRPLRLNRRWPWLSISPAHDHCALTIIEAGRIGYLLATFIGFTLILQKPIQHFRFDDGSGPFTQKVVRAYTRTSREPPA